MNTTDSIGAPAPAFVLNLSSGTDGRSLPLTRNCHHNGNGIALHRKDALHPETATKKYLFPLGGGTFATAGVDEHVEVAHGAALDLRVHAGKTRREDKFDDEQAAIRRNDGPHV